MRVYKTWCIELVLVRPIWQNRTCRVAKLMIDLVVVEQCVTGSNPAMWRRHKASTLSRNFAEATSTRRSTVGSSEVAPSKTLWFWQSQKHEKRKQAEEAGLTQGHLCA
mmetsp:Transcript_42879/g.71428  ORF Transcript_42879/g.71428 Transcript_42879/m.71428 type:complete len:108 (-) Transcript_42879:88-411(-)